jgi:hypothetical protein
VYQGRLVSPTILYMAIKRVVTGIQPAAREPAVEWRIAIIQDEIPSSVPMYGFGCLSPVFVGALDRATMTSSVTVHVA